MFNSIIRVSSERRESHQAYDADGCCGELPAQKPRIDAAGKAIDDGQGAGCSPIHN